MVLNDFDKFEVVKVGLYEIVDDEGEFIFTYQEPSHEDEWWDNNGIVHFPVEIYHSINGLKKDPILGCNISTSICLASDKEKAESILIAIEYYLRA